MPAEESAQSHQKSPDAAPAEQGFGSCSQSLLDLKMTMEEKTKSHEARIQELRAEISNLKKSAKDKSGQNWESFEGEDSMVQREALVGEFLETSQIEKQLQMVMDVNAKSILKSYENFPKDKIEPLSEIIQKHFSWEKVEPLFYSVYTKHYTSQELQTMVRFHSSQTGKAILAKNESVVKDVSELMMKLVKENRQAMEADIKKLMPEKNKE
jgi:hypothetical protein